MDIVGRGSRQLPAERAERQQQYERMSDAERRRYDEALEAMHEEIRRERRRSG